MNGMGARRGLRLGKLWRRARARRLCVCACEFECERATNGVSHFFLDREEPHCNEIAEHYLACLPYQVATCGHSHDHSGR